MYAVFSTGGKQYRATTGDIIKVEKLEAEKGSTVELEQVLMVGEGEDVNVGSPYIEGGKVLAKVVEHGRGEKIKIIKFKRRKHHLKRQGHRQYFTALEITDIVAAGKPKAKAAAEAPAEKPEEAKPAAKKVASKKAVSKKAAAKKAASKKKVAKKTAAKKAEASESKGEE
jgi:large subunit ribosomal protein L21